MGRALLLVVALTGCDALFGLDHIDEAPHTVDGTWTRQYLSNNQNHAPIVEDFAYTAGEIAKIEVHTQDGLSLPFNWDYATGGFEFETAGPYRITLELANGTSEEIQSNLPHIEHAIPNYERPDAVLGDATTTLEGTISPAGAGTVLETTGVWTQYSLGAVGPFSVAWTRPLVNASKFDRLYAARYENKGTFFAITGFGATDFTMTNGQNTGVNIAVVPLTLPWCATVTSEGNAELARMTARYPALDGRDIVGWIIGASPSNDIAPGFLPALAYPVLVQDTLTVNYSTPYTGFGTRFNLVVQRQKAITSPVAVTRYATTASFFAIEDSVTCEPYTLSAGTVALPVDVAVDGAPLTQDGQQVIVGTEPLEVTWTPDGPADIYRTAIVDLTDPARGARTFISIEPRIVIDSAPLTSGHVYMLGIWTYTGVPNARSGDFRTIATTYSSSSVNPPVFVVTRPI